MCANAFDIVYDSQEALWFACITFCYCTLYCSYTLHKTSVIKKSFEAITASVSTPSEQKAKDYDVAARLAMIVNWVLSVFCVIASLGYLTFVIFYLIYFNRSELNTLQRVARYVTLSCVYFLLCSRDKLNCCSYAIVAVLFETLVLVGKVHPSKAFLKWLLIHIAITGVISKATLKLVTLTAEPLGAWYTLPQPAVAPDGE